MVYHMFVVYCLLFHVSNHTLKDMDILNYGTIKKTASIIASSRC